jgi:hypothetical protein
VRRWARRGVGTSEVGEERGTRLDFSTKIKALVVLWKIRTASILTESINLLTMLILWPGAAPQLSKVGDNGLHAE